MWKQIVDFLSAEYVLSKRPNGGSAVFLRSILVSVPLYMVALILHSCTHAGAELVFSVTQLKADVHYTLPWFGAILGAVYLAVYSRFSAQWSYLASLYNQIMTVRVSLNEIGRETNEALAYWEAGFVEDAEDLHLATKPMFAAVIYEMLSRQRVCDAFVASVAGDKQRLLNLQAKIKDAMKPG